MKRAFIITMYNEYGVVEKSIDNIKSTFGSDSHVVVVHSIPKGEDSGISVYKKCDKLIPFPDLSISLDMYKIPSYSLSRNYSAGFTYIYKTEVPFDYIVALCGDTLVTDANNFDRRFTDMKNQNKILCITQAIGQLFYTPDSNPVNGNRKSEIQTDNSTDFMPQFFMVDGEKAIRTKMFSNIEITNQHTSEQCLGDEYITRLIELNKDNIKGLTPNTLIKLFKDNTIQLSRNAYDYNDGIVYQAKG